LSDASLLCIVNLSAEERGTMYTGAEGKGAPRAQMPLRPQKTSLDEVFFSREEKEERDELCLLAVAERKKKMRHPSAGLTRQGVLAFAPHPGRDFF